MLDGNYVGSDFDIDPSGQRLLVVKRDTLPEVDGQNDIILIPNWFDELTRLVPTP